MAPQEDDEPIDMVTVECFVRDGYGWVTSLRIAREVGRPHYYVLDAIDRINTEMGGVAPPVYSVASYRDRQGKSRRCYEVREDAVLNVIRRLRGDGADAIFEHINREFIRLKKAEQNTDLARMMAPPKPTIPAT
jgi:hypothetical protein